MYKKFFKRVFDILISSILIVLLIPIWFIVPIFVKLEDGGPVIFKSERIGKDGQKLYMLKFRSMKVDAPDLRNEDGSTYNSSSDSRVTKIGHFLRETSLDELPQLFNVISGDMSLIGPRASTWDVLDTYKDDEKDKMKVRPGITGYCQAYFRNSVSVREKRLKDAWYATNISFALDVKIAFKTIFTVLKRDSLYTN